MSTALKKGQKVDLTKNSTNLKKILIEFHWQAGQNIDLIATAFLLDNNDKITAKDDLIFFGNLRHKSGCVLLSDNTTIDVIGNAEQIYVDFNRIPNNIEKIVFSISIYAAEERHQNFAQVRNAHIRVINESIGKELFYFNFQENLSVETAVVIAEIYRYKGEWKFNAIGSGFKNGLTALCDKFGFPTSNSTQASPSSNKLSTSNRTSTTSNKTSLKSIKYNNLDGIIIIKGFTWDDDVNPVDSDDLDYINHFAILCKNGKASDFVFFDARHDKYGNVLTEAISISNYYSKLTVDFNNLSFDYDRIIFTAFSPDYFSIKIEGGNVYPYVIVSNFKTNEQLAYYNLSENFPDKNIIIIGELSIVNNQWQLSITGDAIASDSFIFNCEATVGRVTIEDLEDDFCDMVNAICKHCNIRFNANRLHEQITRLYSNYNEDEDEEFEDEDSEDDEIEDAEIEDEDSEDDDFEERKSKKHKETDYDFSYDSEYYNSRDVPLREKIKDNAPELLPLVKPLKAELEKRDLQDTITEVILALSITDSMRNIYEDETIKEIVNKIFPLAVQFDDSCGLRFWYYGSEAKNYSFINFNNYDYAIGKKDWKNIMNDIGHENNIPNLLKEIIKVYKTHYRPVYVIIITDGDVTYDKQISKLLIKSSSMPIFWQFVGINGDNYGILQNLDSIYDRYVDNADFFDLDDFSLVSDSELYARLLNKFSIWLKDVKVKGIIERINAKIEREDEIIENLANKVKSIKNFFGFK